MSDCPVVGGSDINPTNMVCTCLILFPSKKFLINCYVCTHLCNIIRFVLLVFRCLRQINSLRLGNLFRSPQRGRCHQSLKLERVKSSGCILPSKCSGTQCCARVGGGRKRTSKKRTWATSSAFTMQIMSRRGKRCLSGKPSTLTSAETLGSKVLAERPQTTRPELESDSLWGKIFFFNILLF